MSDAPISVVSGGGSTSRLDDIELDLALPTTHVPEGLNFTESEAYKNVKLLEANGYASGRQGWRRATSSQEDLLRVTSFKLLAETPQAEEASHFKRGLEDDNRLVRVFAASGYLALGQEAGRRTLLELLKLFAEGDEFLPVRAFAASELARHGDPRGFPVLLDEMKERSEARHVVFARMMPFVSHQGTRLEDGTEVDVWPHYKKALEGDDVDMQYVAVAQLGEIGGARARKLLEVYVGLRPIRPFQVRAQKSLDALKPSSGER